MKKLLIILMCCLVLAGCGNSGEETKQGDSSNTTSQSEVTEEPENEELEYVNGFEKADYGKFNSYATKNGLGGTKIYVQGTVTEVFDKDNSVGLIIQQSDNEQWLVAIGEEPVIGKSKLEKLLNKTIEIFGEYVGYSDVFDMPHLEIISDDENYYILTDEKQRLAWRDFFADMTELHKWYKNNSEEIFLSDRTKEKNRNSFKTSTGVVEYIYRTDDGFIIDFVQKLNSKYSVQSATVDDMILCEVDVLEGVKIGDGIKSYYYIDEDGEANLLAMEKVKAGFNLSDYKKSIKKSYKSKCKEYTYEQMARNPKKVKGKYAKLTGEVVQVMEDGDFVELRVNITKDSYGYYSDTVYVYYTMKSKKGDRILEDDIITIYGKLAGTETYTSVLGSEITLPKINAEYIELNKIH